jgi:hypothetical protein
MASDAAAARGGPQRCRRSVEMAWEVEYTDEFRAWFDELTAAQQAAVHRRVAMLVDQGPALGAPLVKVIESSRHYPRMKELRCSQDGALRVLFTFDPRRTAILLVGGDKSGQWREWYRLNIPLADDIYEEYLRELQNEGLL